MAGIGNVGSDNVLNTGFSGRRVSGEGKGQGEDFAQLFARKKEEIFDKVMNNDTEESFQLGAQSFTATEWNKLIDSVDKAEEAVKEDLEERIEKARAEEFEKKLEEELEDGLQ